MVKTVGELKKELARYRDDLFVAIRMTVSDRDNPRTGYDRIPLKRVESDVKPGSAFIVLEIDQ